VTEELIRTLSLTLVITSVSAVELRRLRSAAVAYVLQALLIVLLLVSFAGVNPALYWWAGTALLTKAILVPLFLFWAIGATAQEKEKRPLIGFGPSLIVAAGLMLTFYYLTHRYAAHLAPAELAQHEVFRTNLAVASTVFALGLYCALTRRDAIKIVIGLCLLENGVHLSLVSLAPGLPETALFGVASEVVVTVFLMLYVIRGVREKFGTTDTLELRELQW
jgi:hydrogenase-4 component E